MSQTPLFGVNYVPSQDWMYQWMNIDENAVRRDFESIAALGMDHVRVFPLWPVLQPNRGLIRQSALADVRRVVEIAAEFGLDVFVDAIQGHMSGYDFVPNWLLNWHRGNMFTDDGAVDAQVNLVGAIGAYLDDLDNYAGMTLGNEVNQFVGPPNPDAMTASSVDIERWLVRLLEAARPTRSSRVAAHSENDHVWYRDGHPFLPAHASRLGTVSTVHSWVFNGTGQQYGGLSDESVNHAEYLLDLTRAFATDPKRMLWLQEVGAPSICLTESEMPEFVERTFHAALRTENLFGVTWWCSHDVDRRFLDFKDVEYSLGLLGTDQSVKPIGARLAALIEQARRSMPTPVRVADETIEIQVDDADVPLSRASLAPGGSVFESWHRSRSAGRSPRLQIVPALNV